MKKIIGIVFASFMFCNIGFAERAWVETDYNISYYLKNNWALTFVNAIKGFNNDEIFYTLQKSKLIISCRISGSKHRHETCYKAADQE